MKILQRTIWPFVLILILCFSVFGTPARADDAGALPRSLYLTQSRHGTCTLASAAMMLRARLYLDGSDAWSDATEQSVAATAWCSDGLYWSFSYAAGDETLTVNHQSLAGVSTQALRDLLADHPEGIVLYCGALPHAVFLTDYADGVFWCADPVYGVRLPLADSYLGIYGSQESILRNVTACWFVAYAA